MVKLRSSKTDPICSTGDPAWILDAEKSNLSGLGVRCSCVTQHVSVRFDNDTLPMPILDMSNLVAIFTFTFGKNLAERFKQCPTETLHSLHKGWQPEVEMIRDDTGKSMGFW